MKVPARVAPQSVLRHTIFKFLCILPRRVSHFLAATSTYISMEQIPALLATRQGHDTVFYIARRDSFESALTSHGLAFSYQLPSDYSLSTLRQDVETAMISTGCWKFVTNAPQAQRSSRRRLTLPAEDHSSISLLRFKNKAQPTNRGNIRMEPGALNSSMTIKSLIENRDKFIGNQTPALYNQKIYICFRK